MGVMRRDEIMREALTALADPDAWHSMADVQRIAGKALEDAKAIPYADRGAVKALETLRDTARRAQVGVPGPTLSAKWVEQVATDALGEQ